MQYAVNAALTKSGRNYMTIYFNLLESEIPAIKQLPQKADATGFLIQEIIRFYSIAGTLSHNGLKLDVNSSIDERYLTHILSRSLLENYFTIIYLFDDPSQTSKRYEELKNSFKQDYKKLMNNLNDSSWHDFMQAHQADLEPANSTWMQAKGLPDVNTMLTGLRNDYNDRLSYLYPIYRITSFDTHGRSLGTIFEAVFGKKCNFPVLNIRHAFELMANQYLVVVKDLRSRGEI
jgi:hypothetical protein